MGAPNCGGLFGHHFGVNVNTDFDHLEEKVLDPRVLCVVCRVRVSCACASCVCACVSGQVGGCARSLTLTPTPNCELACIPVSTPRPDSDPHPDLVIEVHQELIKRVVNHCAFER